MLSPTDEWNQGAPESSWTNPPPPPPLPSSILILQIRKLGPRGEVTSPLDYEQS